MVKGTDCRGNGARKSVAVVTFHSWINGNLNYGATLQAYALCKAIGQLGFSVELVDYVPEVIGADNALKNLYRRIFRFLITRKVPRRKRQGFQGFIEANCPLGSRRYNRFGELLLDPPVADVYVSGSDQVWNTGIFHGTLFPAFFLGFGDPAKRRISYASSFGTHMPDIRFKDEIVGLLRHFSAISVREASGVEVVGNLLGDSVPAACVLDPTLLLSDYDSVLEPMGTDGMLLAYLFEPTGEDVALLRETASELSLRPGLVWDRGMPEFKGVGLVECNSPAQWLGAMKKASAIVTNSFHGTVFSILFQHPFVSLLADAKGASNRNTRVLDLSKKLGLGGCLTPERNAATWLDVLNRPVEWGTVEECLAEERGFSMEYLRNAIEGGRESGKEHGEVAR